MKVILTFLKSKYFPYILVALCVTTAILGFYLRSTQVNRNDKLQNHNRQLNGQLSNKERELQAAHSDLDISKSRLVGEKELVEKWKKEKLEVTEDYTNFIKKHNLQITSRDKTIARLKQTIKGGLATTTITEKPDASTDTLSCGNLLEHCVIAYNWQDPFSRFHLMDPNIFTEKDEITFTALQMFKIYGEIFTQKDGSLQVHRLVLREIYEKNGKIEEIPGAKAEIIDSEFEYVNPPRLDVKTRFKDLFKIRMIALASITFIPDLGRTQLGLGMEVFNFKGFGLNTHTNLDFKDARKIGQNIGISYSPKIAGLDLNVGINVSIGTPFAKMFQELLFSSSLVFYINN